ncbi:MAG: aminopeptidase [Polaromonas sp.]|nr:aminopeptidase [Polaromonas sp.]MDP3751372.1 aminopeptidase [Polaromonas sp.]
MPLARLTAMIAGTLLLGLSGCASLGYYWQSVHGHLNLMNAARPVDDWLQDADTPEKLKARLALSQQIRRFAVSELSLPDNASYQRYADLKRKAVVWNVSAAPEFSLTLKTWCFPVTGCVGYKGYFDEAEARAEADQLSAQGLEVSVYGVPAYSTLGWMNWAGGDPLLNTFITYPEGELARLIFHELAHQVVYVADDMAFNESFATAVERLGSARWLARHGSDAARADYARFSERRQQFRNLTLGLRRELSEIYESNTPSAHDRLAQAAMKTIAFQTFHQRYAELKTAWGGYAGYDPWVARTNNASLAALAAYDDLVPGFEALFVREGSHWPRFYDAVRKLAAMQKAQRHQALTHNNPKETPHG